MSTFINIFTKKIKSNYIRLENSSTPVFDSYNQIYTKFDVPYYLDTGGNETKILHSNYIAIENKHIINSVENISLDTTLSSSNANIININNCTLTLPNPSTKLSFIIIGTGTVGSIEGLTINLVDDKLSVISNGSSWYIV